ncbi:TPR-like protein [Testicularia cyperi]|uniref:TPR-like protein n=1 Tax=Testicularia cyperi TaxID=1882483 RepID=A0A317Y072_9BASI|nr:TPR-like protein [Testicularia cyperi]
MNVGTSRLAARVVGRSLASTAAVRPHAALRRGTSAAMRSNLSLLSQRSQQALMLSQRTYATSTTPASSAVDPADEESQRFLEEGTMHLESGDLEQAKKSYQRSLEIKESASALFNLGVCYYHDRNLDGAIESWKGSLRLSPDSADAHTNLASAYVLSKPSRPDLAVSHLKTAASITPDDPEIQYNLAAVLEACEQLEEALTAYKRALDGGIQRAEQNIRNCSAKLLSAKFAVQEQQKEEEEAKLKSENEKDAK